MKRTDEVRRVDSCLNKAHDDEPLFVLRSNDPGAPQAVRAWAMDYRVRKIGENFDTTGKAALTDIQRAKFEEALKCADDMELWRSAHQQKKG